MYISETIKKHSTNNTKHSTFKYTYYQNTQPHGHEDKNTGNNSPPRQGNIQELKLLLHSYYTTHL